MTPEMKKSLGRVIRTYREGLNWTQQRLAGAAEVDLRTVQRAEAGEGIGKENLSAIAAAFNLDEAQLLKEARNKGDAPPEKRFSLRKLNSGVELTDVLDQAIKSETSLEIGLRDEHEFNEFIGDYLLTLSDQIENSNGSKRASTSNNHDAEHIIRLCAKMGFGLFAGNYVEELKSKKGTRKNKTTQVVAASNTDSRIKKTANGLTLDLVRDSRRLLQGGVMNRQTTYDWLEHQLLAKSDGEERVKDTLRRLLSEIAQELETSHRRKGKRNK